MRHLRIFNGLEEFDRFHLRGCFGGKGGSTPPPPDYSAMSKASDYAADLGHKLGTEQLNEARRQYDQNMSFAKPIVDAQKGLMDQALKQGEDYYEYGKRGRPVEDALNAESMKDYTARDAAERNAILGSQAEIEAGRYGQDIQQQVGTAIGDVRQGTTQQMNQLMRQGLRYGYSPQAMAAQFGSGAVQSGLGQAGAANAARAGAVANARGMLTQGRAMRQQDDSINWAKKMDVAGLYRGMPGASQGAYGLALGAGNSAMQGNMAPGQALLGGMAQGAGMQQTGAGQRLQGQSSILGSQSQLYGQGMQIQSQAGGGTGQLLGSLAGAGMMAFAV